MPWRPFIALLIDIGSHYHRPFLGEVKNKFAAHTVSTASYEKNFAFNFHNYNAMVIFVFFPIQFGGKYTNNMR